MSYEINAVRFVLDGRVVEAKGKRRTTTVLDYLREELQRTGTKEGCAEGDCGACVVLVGTVNARGDGIDYQPVNSCMQLLPSLDGKSVKTVESLKRSDGSLHPVQQAMIACHGSQCGFCTPGIVMSLAGMVQIHPQPTRAQVNDALSGNLCRCTGYKPIVDAALSACQRPAADLKLDDAADLALLRGIAPNAQPSVNLNGDVITEPVVRTKKGSEFVAPANAEALAAYLLAHPDATLVAGSTEIGLQVNKDYIRPSHIAYLGNVAELQRIEESSSAWKFGAAVSLARVMTTIEQAYPDFHEVLRRFGSPPIRSTATLAGNIANGSPIGDSMPCLIALGAVLHLRKGSARRTVLLEDFYTGMKKSVLQASEFIEFIELPKPQSGTLFRAHKISKRFDQDISATCCAMQFRVESGVLRGVRMGYNGVAASPCRAPKIEAVLEGRRPEDVRAADIDAAIAASFPARDGLRATWAYRSLVARNLVMQFVEDAAPALAA
jgi:xanthine dehydrogenase small subunit